MKNTDQVPPSVYDFEDYRQFLKEIYEYRRKNGPQLSFRQISKAAGYKSPSFLSDVIGGRRNLSRKSAEQLAHALRLNASEHHYFVHLVQLAHAKTHEDRAHYRVQLELATKNKNLHPISGRQLQYYEHWYYIPIRELVAIPGFKEDPEEIAQTLGNLISPLEARIALETLVTLGLIKRDPEGLLSQSSPLVSTHEHFIPAGLADYHRKMMELGIESISRIQRKERDITAATITATADQAEEIKGMIAQLRQKVLSIGNQAPTAQSQIFQVNFQLFPLSGPKKRRP